MKRSATSALRRRAATAKRRYASHATAAIAAMAPASAHHGSGFEKLNYFFTFASDSKYVAIDRR
jgi:hypothetical protein